MKSCLILANGDPPKKSVISFLQNVGYDTLICADGGANSAKKLGIIPEYIIGDFDSITKETIKYFSKKSKFIKIVRQNDTDVEKAIKYAIKKNFENVILLGATGDRLDHTFCNIGIILKFHNRINISILHANSFMSVHDGEISIQTQPQEIISIYGIDSKTTISSSGLKYPLRNIKLPFGKKESTSNVALKNEIKLKIQYGKILVVRNYDILRKNGFFRHP